MFPANAFAPRYFAPRYWAKVGEDPTPITFAAGATYEVRLQERPGGPYRLARIIFTGN